MNGQKNYDDIAIRRLNFIFVGWQENVDKSF